MSQILEQFCCSYLFILIILIAVSILKFGSLIAVWQAGIIILHYSLGDSIYWIWWMEISCNPLSGANWTQCKWIRVCLFNVQVVFFACYCTYFFFFFSQLGCSRLRTPIPAWTFPAERTQRTQENKRRWVFQSRIAIGPFEKIVPVWV